MPSNFRNAADGRSIPFAIIVGDDNEPTDWDQYSRALVFMDDVHRRIHQGQMFETSFYNAALADAANLDVLLTTGSKYPHTRLSAAATGSCLFSLYHTPTTSAAGTAMTVTNRDQNSSNTAVLIPTSGPTVTDVGTLIARSLIAGGTTSGHGTVGSDFDSFEEYVLKPNFTYLLRLTNISGSAVKALSQIMFYEPS